MVRNEVISNGLPADKTRMFPLASPLRNVRRILGEKNNAKVNYVQSGEGITFVVWMRYNEQDLFGVP